MIASVIALVAATVAGAPLARRLDPEAPVGRWLGLSYLVGLGLFAGVLLAFALAGIRWSLVLVAVTAFAVSAAFIRRTPIRAGRPHPIDLLSVIVLAAYASFATASRPWELDFLDNWGLKGRLFHLHGGIDWGFLQTPWYWWSHPDYPPLVPLAFDLTSLFAGRWNDAGAGAIYAGFAMATLLVIRSLAAEELETSMEAAIAGLVMVWLVVTPWIGLADGPLVAFATTALLFIRRGNVTAGAILLGLGASCKNEGVAFIAAAAIGMLADRDLRREVARLWPAAAIAAPWLIARSVQHLATDLAAGSMSQRVLEHLAHPGAYLRLLAQYGFGQWLFWLGIATAAMAAGWRAMARERFVLVTLAAQFASYIAAYLVTPLDVAFHIRWSWDRLLAHLTPALAAVVLLTILPIAASRSVAVDQKDGSGV